MQATESSSPRPQYLIPIPATVGNYLLLRSVTNHQFLLSGGIQHPSWDASEHGRLCTTTLGLDLDLRGPVPKSIMGHRHIDRNRSTADRNLHTALNLVPDERNGAIRRRRWRSDLRTVAHSSWRVSVSLFRGYYEGPERQAGLLL